MGRYLNQVHFVLVFSVIIYFGFFAASWDDGETTSLYASHNKRNILKGITAVIVVFVSHSILRPYADSVFQPFERVWRAVAAFSSCYLYFLVFLLFQNPNFARKVIMPILQQNLGEPRIDKIYDQSCDLTIQVISENIDLYFFFHCINWFFAALVMRDFLLLHLWSVLDQILELTAQHKMVHLRECWFDHLILDILVANSLGIYVGMKTLKLFKFEIYDWLGRNGTKSWREWKVFHCHRRIAGATCAFFIIIVNFYGGFFFTDVLWVHPTDFIACIRVTIWFLLGMLAFNETYRDMKTWGTKQREENPVEARYRWLAFAIVLIQFLITIKFHEGAPNYLDTPTPLYKSVPWAVVILSGTIFYLYHRFRKGHTVKLPSRVQDIKSEQKHPHKKNGKAGQNSRKKIKAH